MTVDERLNKIEDEIQKLKNALNHNAGVSRKLNTQVQTTLTSLQTQITEIKTQNAASNVSMGDIFGSGPFGGKK